MQCPTPLSWKFLWILCGVPTLVWTSDQMFQIGMCGVPPPILKHLLSSVVSLAQLVSPSVALPAELVIPFLHLMIWFIFFSKFFSLLLFAIFFRQGWSHLFSSEKGYRVTHCTVLNVVVIGRDGSGVNLFYSSAYVHINNILLWNHFWKGISWHCSKV